jgi:hypothetical protein
MNKFVQDFEKEKICLIQNYIPDQRLKELVQEINYLEQYAENFDIGHTK